MRTQMKQPRFDSGNARISVAKVVVELLRAPNVHEVSAFRFGAADAVGVARRRICLGTKEKRRDRVSRSRRRWLSRLKIWCCGAAAWETLMVRRRIAPSRTMRPRRCHSSFETPATQAPQDEVWHRSVLALVDQRALLDPRHHVAELGADFLDRVFGELGAGGLERGLVDLVLQHPVAGELAALDVGEDALHLGLGL